jgi:hypothetical protein
MKQKTLFRRMKTCILNVLKFEDEDDKEVIEKIQKTVNIGELVLVLRDYAWDVPSIIGIIVEAATGDEKVEGRDLIPMHYDT